MDTDYVKALEARVLQLEAQRRTDPLTGAGNLLAFQETCAAFDGRAVVLLFDVTNLKRANTALGHFGADALLVAVGRALRDGWDMVFRHGGDEFAVVLPGCDVAGGRAVRDRIEQAVGGVTLDDGSVVRVIGAVATGCGVDALNHADRRLEQRKAAWKRATGQMEYAR